MKKWIMAIIVLAVSLLSSACQPPATPTPNIQETVNAQVAAITTQTAVAQAQVAVIATQTAIARVQVTNAAEKAAVVATQTALAAVPTDAPILPTLTPTSATAPTVVPTSTAFQKPTPVPTRVPVATPLPGGVSCPFYVYADWNSDKNHYAPAGWMGDTGDIQLDDNYTLDPIRPNVMRITYTPGGPMNWAGVYWWDPPDAYWANKDGGFNLSCATKLTFWARGEKGGEKAEFKVGGLDETYKDSVLPAHSTGPIVLTNAWQQYTLDLNGQDLSHIIGGFVWSTNVQSNPAGATIYLDDIRFE